MQSEELLALTASEPLTMEEEEDMQRQCNRSRVLDLADCAQIGKWHTDEDSKSA